MGISRSLPSGPHLIQGTHPFSGTLSRFHQGQGLGGGDSDSVGKGSRRAGSTPISRLLQPTICGDEGLRVVEASDRPLVTESEDSEDFLQDGDSPVGSALSPTWGLNGVSGLEGCLFGSSGGGGGSVIDLVGVLIFVSRHYCRLAVLWFLPSYIHSLKYASPLRV